MSIYLAQQLANRGHFPTYWHTYLLDLLQDF